MILVYYLTYFAHSFVTFGCYLSANLNANRNAIRVLIANAEGGGVRYSKITPNSTE